MARGFGKKQAKALNEKKAKKKMKTNSGWFGSSGASDKRRSGTSDKNLPRQPRVSASGKRVHNEKSHEENVAIFISR